MFGQDRQPGQTHLNIDEPESEWNLAKLQSDKAFRKLNIHVYGNVVVFKSNKITISMSIYLPQTPI